MSSSYSSHGASVRLFDVERRWGASTALAGISFSVEAGSFCVLLGPSGCGKTTLLRIVAGLEQASGGRVEIGGRDVTNLPPAARGVAMVFQSYALFPHLNVRENILFGLKARSVNPKAQESRHPRHRRPTRPPPRSTLRRPATARCPWSRHCGRSAGVSDG